MCTLLKQCGKGLAQDSQHTGNKAQVGEGNWRRELESVKVLELMAAGATKPGPPRELAAILRRVPVIETAGASLLYQWQDHNPPPHASAAISLSVCLKSHTPSLGLTDTKMEGLQSTQCTVEI